MKIFHLNGLGAGGKTRIRQVQFGAADEPLVLAVQAGDDKGGRSVIWLQLPDGKELRRRDLPGRGGEPDAGLSPDLATLAYVERGEQTDWLVVEQPAQAALGRRYLHPWRAADVQRAEAEGWAAEVRYLAIGFSRDGSLLRTCDTNMGFVGWTTAGLFSGTVPPNPAMAPRYSELRTGDAIGPQTTCLRFGPGNAAAVSEGLAYEDSEREGFVAVGDANGSTSVMEQGGMPFVALDLSSEGPPVRAVAFNHWSTVTCVAKGSRVVVWDNVEPAEETILATITGHEGDVTGVDFAPDGNSLVTVGVDGTVRFWSFLDEKVPNEESEDVETRRTEVAARLVLNPGLGELTAVAISPDGCLCAIGTADGRLAAIDVPG